LDRRRFLKYAGVGIVAGAAVVGGATYYLGEKPKLPETVTTANTTSTSTSEATTIYGPPQIAGLAYTPTRVLNDKIYDIRVDVEIFDPARRLSSVLVALEPVAYAHLPTDAFLQEETRTAALQSAGMEKEILSTVFSDLKGGREYDLRAGAADPSGVVDERTSRTDYIREFENLGAMLESKGVTVIADYYTWYESPGKPNAAWGAKGTQHAHVYNPLLGEYSSFDPVVIAKHIDWATGYGINAFAISWWGETSMNPNNPGANPNDLPAFEDAFLKHNMLSQIKFCILYENNGRLKIRNPDDPAERWIEDLDDSFNRSRLLSDFEYLTKYFSNSQYLRIDGRPCARFDYTAPFRGDIQGVFDEVRSKLRTMGWEIYLINDLAGRSNYPSDLVSAEPLDWRYPNISPVHTSEVIENTDAIGGSGPPPGENYKIWRDFAMGRQKDFVPLSWPGQHIHPSICRTCVPVPRSPEYFRGLLEQSIRYATKKTIEIAAFDEWYAGIGIEPAQEYGITYLEVLKEAVTKW